jgi:hypothetical protein
LLAGHWLDLLQPVGTLPLVPQFFCSPSFTSAIGDFMAKHAEQLDFVPLDQEQPLRNHEIFK